MVSPATVYPKNVLGLPLVAIPMGTLRRSRRPVDPVSLNVPSSSKSPNRFKKKPPTAVMLEPGSNVATIELGSESGISMAESKGAQGLRILTHDEHVTIDGRGERDTAGVVRR